MNEMYVIRKLTQFQWYVFVAKAFLLWRGKFLLFNTVLYFPFFVLLFYIGECWIFKNNPIVQVTKWGCLGCI